MNVFPSDNEKIITSVIVATITGLFIGFIAGTKINDANIVITSISTLSAAFMGAWFAYKLQDKAKQRKELENLVNNANSLLLALFQKLNALKLFQIDSVEPWRDTPGNMIGMRPILDFKLPDAPIKPEDINFLLKTKYTQLLFDAHIEERRFQTVEDIIKFRSDLHFKYVQPAIQAAGLNEGTEHSGEDYKNALGEMLFRQLERSTNDVIYHVDRTVKSSDELREKLIKALKELYPDETFINFILLEKSPNN